MIDLDEIKLAPDLRASKVKRSSRQQALRNLENARNNVRKQPRWLRQLRHQKSKKR